MKIVKVALKALLWLVVLVIVVLLTLPLWFGPVAKTVANAAVPGVVKTDFRLDHLSLNPYTARFELAGLRLANPAGYSEHYAATVGDIAFDANTFSLMTDVIHIEEIKIKDVFVSYVSGGPEKVNNFTQIQYNVAGGKEKYEADRSAKKAEASGRSAVQKEDPAALEKTESPKSEKRFIIDRLEISGLMIQLGFLPIRQPMPLVMTDIGRSTGGATVKEISQQVWDEILKAAGMVGDQLKALGGAAGHATKSVKAFGESTKELGSAVQSLGSGLKTGKGAKAVSDGAKAVGEGAKKAMNSLKGLL